MNRRTDIMSISDAARWLRCTKQNVAYLLDRGLLKGRKLHSRCWVVTRASVEKRAREKGIDK